MKYKLSKLFSALLAGGVPLYFLLSGKWDVYYVIWFFWLDTFLEILFKWLYRIVWNGKSDNQKNTPVIGEPNGNIFLLAYLFFPTFVLLLIVINFGTGISSLATLLLGLGVRMATRIIEIKSTKMPSNDALLSKPLLLKVFYLVAATLFLVLLNSVQSYVIIAIILFSLLQFADSFTKRE